MEDAPSNLRQSAGPGSSSRGPELAKRDIGAANPRISAPSFRGPRLVEFSAACSKDFPVMHFSSGPGGRPTWQDFLKTFNSRDYDRARAILTQRKHEFLGFQQYMSSWMLAAVVESPAAALWRQLAERQASSGVEEAALFENQAFLAIRSGDWEEAKRLCEEGIAICATVEGLWVNLIVAMDRLGEDRAIERILLRLPEVFDLDRGLLGLYLSNDPAFRTVVCNGG
jgi:hypothetical protein